MLKNPKKGLLMGGMYVFVITSVSVNLGILAQMKCPQVIKFIFFIKFIHGKKIFFILFSLIQM